MMPQQVEKALQDPAAVFATPESVLAETGLSRSQKIEILMRWEYDAAEQAVALEEGMPGKETDLLRRILLTLGELGAPVDVERVGPTKQHGVSHVRLLPVAPAEVETLPGLGPESYTHWRSSELGQITERIERQLMLDLIGDVSDRELLDIGCGDGDFTLVLARRGARVSGIDASPAMIAAAARKAIPLGLDVTFSVGQARALPFADASFDVVVAMTILCFVHDATPVFAEIARVLRPGGRLIIGELGKWSTWAVERRIRAWAGSALWKRGRFRTPGELQRLARGAGLQPGPVRGAAYFPRLRFAARAMQGVDADVGRLTTFGAAFLALEATKPATH